MLRTRRLKSRSTADRQTVRRLARQVAEEHGWDEDWLNDGVKGFLSAADSNAEAKRLFRTYPSEAEPGLRVMVANPAYLFAMKCRAMRIGGVDETADVDDIRRLAKEIGLSSAQEALDLVAEYYPAGLIEPKTRFGLEEIFDKLIPRNRSSDSGSNKS